MSTVTAGALTAVIGYIGSEVAEENLLERLLWPERFNNDMTISVVLQQCLLMTAGGPLHKAALKTLETLRQQGLFAGSCRGHMLGSVFFPEFKIMHFQRCKEARRLIPEKSRNSFWIRVLHSVRAEQHVSFKIPRQDAESNQLSDAYRSLQPVYHLKLGIVGSAEKPGPNEVCVNEDGTSLTGVLSCVLSELTSVLASLIAGLKLKELVFALYLLVPLLLKLLLIAFSVRRVKLMTEEELHKVAEKEDTDLSKTEAFEVADPIHKFMVIEGPQPVVVQFFRHYGHPVRDRDSLWIGDRLREVACITVICCLFLFFPVGLVIAQCSDENAQYLWLSYELYAVIAMHIVRVCGWQDIGRIEKRIARLMSNGKTVWLKTGNGCTVSATLVIHGVTKTAEGKEKVQEIIDECTQRLVREAQSVEVEVEVETRAQEDSPSTQIQPAPAPAYLRSGK
ncbi:hypothetical protein M440DRAFT_1352650 [Trichoderma longibrachiatum ATCC 18648]|uniref:Uncharacterized protein n=1 Tax=Trichoderma longibrachiatum ATCC 18648 TaxID=983965 RepID=A0A2T4CB98_TRILO|nr:hypothetical protein M440DRAFT_1352650 [Trichoderma longibrachiatum ATCC 18648]